MGYLGGKLIMQLPYNPAVVLFPGIYPKEMKTYSLKNPYVNVHNSFAFNNHKRKIIHMSFNEWLSKLSIPIPWNTTHQYKEMNCWHMWQCGWILRALCWMTKDQSRKLTYHMILFIQHSWNDKIVEMEKRFVVSRD